MSAEDAAADVRHVEWEDALRLEREAARESGRVEAAGAIERLLLSCGASMPLRDFLDMVRETAWRAFLPGEAKDGG